MKTKKIIRALSKYFPKSLKASYDRVGLMVGPLKEETNTIVLALDYDDIVYDEIIKRGLNVDLILTHHPFIFGPKMRVLKHDPIKAALFEKTVQAKMPVYSMHTNFDTGKRGMNDALAEKMNLGNAYAPISDKMMRIGELSEAMNVYDFANFVKETFDLPFVELLPYGKQEIKKVAVIGGGGSRAFTVAKDEGADIFISGDVVHHVRRDIVLQHFNYLNVYHEIERIFMPQMKKLLLEIDPTLNVVIIDHETYPVLIK